MERKRDHRNDGVQIDLYNAIIQSCVTLLHTLEIIWTFVDFKVLFYLVIGSPYRRKTCGLRSHGINAISKIHGHAAYARSDEFKNFILYKVVFKYLSDDAQSHIHRSYPRLRGAGHEHADDLRVIDLIVFSQHGLGQLRTTLTDGNRALGAVTGMGIGNDGHIA